MRIQLLGLLATCFAERVTSPGPLIATPAAGIPQPSTTSMGWLTKLKYYFKPTEESQQQTILGESFDRYLTNVVLQYKFSSENELANFREAVASLVIDTWYLDSDHGVVCLAASQIDDFDQLLLASLRDTKAVTLSDVHRSVIRTFPLHPVELPAQDFANTSEILRYTETLSHINIGTSWEGRPIRAVTSPDESEERSTLYVCGVHGREWASVSCCLSLIESMKPSEAVIPLANPDGYHHTWLSDRMWSKNMQPTALSFCPGHDLARGLLDDYDESATQCSESWCGKESDSPLEVRAIKEYAKDYKKVVIIQGTERSPKAKVSVFGNQTIRISLPDYGAGFLVSRNHLEDAVRSVRWLIDSLRISS